jgi:UDP-N-acetylmuramoyl-tripeptide--D-alanyl-D-alanine ligase
MSIQLIPNEIIKATGGRFIAGLGLTMIISICVDSRKVTPGCLFVPLKGDRRDGHSFIEDALSKGAAATLVGSDSGVLGGLKRKYTRKILIEVDDPLTALGDLASFWRYKFRPAVVVIAGTGRVHETREMAWNIIRHHYGVLTNSLDGNSLKELPLSLMKLNAEHKAVLYAVDTFSTAGMKRFAEICNPTVGLVTGTNKQDRGEMKKLLQCLDKGSTAIINSDHSSLKLLEKSTSARVMTFGLKKGDIRASNIRHSKDGQTTFALHVMEKATEVTIALPDECSVSSALGAAAIASIIGLTIEDIKEGLEG